MTVWSRLCAAARPFAVVLGIGLVAGACTALPGDGPWMGGAQTTSTEALPFDVIDLTPTTVVAYRQAPTPDRPATTTSQLSPAQRLVVAPGDSLKVRIFERYGGNIFPTIQGQSADLGIQRVGEDGSIKVPVVGNVQVAGLDLNQIERRIIQQLGTQVQEPEVIVEFDAPRTHTVMVSGDVKNPGRVSMLEDVRSVVDAINKAGGPVASPTGSGANQLQVVVRRNGQVILTSQFSDLLAGNDIAVQKGDEIIVRPNSRIFTVLGAVLRSGNVEMTKHNLTLLEALGQVGGLNDVRANKTGVYVFRMGDLETNPTARGRVFRLDLFQPVSIFVAQQFGLQPRDVIYVTNAPLYEYDKILTSIYRTFSIIGIARGNIPLTTTF
ncbi:polysaccharide export outer membrane protein [Rhodospirillales bacterium URHD0017]|nr:polysaccharide export outer membrane protein [Rhodospirillales bacterium URHD0017]